MKDFINEDFLLHSDVAKMLYHEHAEKMPIIDYHCHLNPKMIADDYKFSSITEIWLGGDHYKWRAMRANGVDEKYITGKETSDWEKFEKWAETVPYTLRNPLYHWTHLELKTAFGIGETLNPASAKRIYDKCNELLATPEYSARGLMKRYNVESVCTTDDPIDTLEYHKAIADSGFEVKVLPTWRPDKAMNVTTAAEYRAYLEKLSQASGVTISKFDDLVEALKVRHQYFADHGCKLADHGLADIPAADYTMAEISAIFDKVYGGNELTKDEKTKYQAALLIILSEMNAEAGWTQQYHYGPLRNTNSRMMAKLGPDTGFDTIGDFRCAEAMVKIFDRLNSEGKLAKTILYNINPSENDMVAAMIANYQDGSVPGKMQFGSGWWFNDQMGGMLRQMNALSEQGLLSRFVGMLTDSRSFLSYPRHEYFRRILCNMIGNDVVNGILPESEMGRIKGMIEDICYCNAQAFLALKASAYIRICFTIARSPLLLVGERCSFSPIFSMKYKSDSSISSGVCPDTTFMRRAIIPFTIRASLSAWNIIFPSSISA